MEYQYSKIRLNSTQAFKRRNEESFKENIKQNIESIQKSLRKQQLRLTLKETSRITKEPSRFNFYRRTSRETNPGHKTVCNSINSNKGSRIKMDQYLNIITNRDLNSTNHNKLKNSYYPYTDVNVSREEETKSSQYYDSRFPKKQYKSAFPYNQVSEIISKIYKNYDVLLKLGYSTDQIINIIRQISQKRRNLQLLFLNRKQKPKRLYYTYQLKKQSECMEAIIKESFENKSGRFQYIVRDISNFSIFFQDEIIDRGCSRIKEIKRSIIGLKEELESNEYSEQLGFNNYNSKEGEEGAKSVRSKFAAENKDALTYISVINRNIDEELVKIENEMGDFLDKNRNAVDVLAKIKRNISK